MRTAILISLFAVVSISLSAQESPAGPDATNRGGGQVMGERDQSKEDQIASLFESIRSSLDSRKLTRIRHRDNLEQEVCTMALTGSLPNRSLAGTFAFYRTLQPDAVAPELTHVASFDALHPKNKAGYHRFSVAVWRTTDSQTKETLYWVGVQLYWSAPAEFFDYHFTDDIYYHNGWKKSVAPQCRGK
jgi:hypothetical protein